MCLQCGKCEQRCPQNTGLKDMFTRLRELSIKKGNRVRIIEDKIKMLLEEGYAMPKRSGVRKRMNISEAPKIDATQIKGILKRAKEDGADDK